MRLSPTRTRRGTAAAARPLREGKEGGQNCGLAPSAVCGMSQAERGPYPARPPGAPAPEQKPGSGAACLPSDTVQLLTEFPPRFGCVRVYAVCECVCVSVNLYE